MTQRFSILFLCAVLAVLPGCSRESNAAKAAPERPALTVSAVTPAMQPLRRHIEATGSVAPWHEAIVGSEIGGLKVSEVLANVGDRVKKGQVLARFSDETVRNDLAQQEASLREAEATLAQAKANIERARALEPSGSISRQDILNYETQAATTEARVASSRVLLAAQRLRLGYTQVLSPDDGVISSRSATVGSVTATGQELFKLIRQNRLEWRGEMRAEDLARAKPGQVVVFRRPEGRDIEGKVRQVGPTVDAASRLGIVYVDLPAEGPLHAGMFIGGSLVLSNAPAMVLPQSAVIDRDGLYYAFRLGPDNRVAKVKVSVGRREGESIEVIEGLRMSDRVVASGGAFLNEGDLVRVVEAPKPAAAAAK
jgi:RND family efflux transporter MFP subunit